MAHFAQLDENNNVIWVTRLDNELVADETGSEQESLGIQHIHNTIPGSENYTWKQTSYNNNFRGRYASVGFTYDPELDIFKRPQPYPSWTFSVDINDWIPPVPRPDITQEESVKPQDVELYTYNWNEDSQSWDLEYTG